MAADKPVIHGRDHLPGGADPIPRLVTTDNVGDFAPSGGMTILDLPLTGDTPLATSGWCVDTTTLIPGYPLCLVHKDTGPDSLYWLVHLQHGGWTVSFSANFGEPGVSDGTMTFSVAGAYDFTDDYSDPRPVDASPDWLQIAQIDLSDYSASPFYTYTREWGLDGAESTVFSIRKPSIVPKYALSTALATGFLNGSEGWYYLRLDGEGDIVIARALLTLSDTFVSGFIDSI